MVSILDVPRELTVTRIKHVIEQSDLLFELDQDGVVTVAYDNAAFVINLSGPNDAPPQIIEVMGRWRAQIPLIFADQITEFAINTNCLRISPKTLAVTNVTDGEESIILATSASIFSPSGINDQQLTQFLNGAFQTGLQIFDAASRLFPELCTWKENQSDQP